MTINYRPIIAITMGDAAGIGPEIAVKVLSSMPVYQICRPLLIGSASVMSATIEWLKSPLVLRPVQDPGEAGGEPGGIDICDLDNLRNEDFTVGRVSAACGRASMEFIAAAARMALKGDVAAVVTAPINKEATALAGYGDVGHLEYFARITGTTEYATMLTAGHLRVVHLTTHYSLKESCAYVKKVRILARLKLIHESFKKWGVPRPLIGVAALNPHGGEGGLFGREEIEEIAPAIAEARDSGIDARGPYPADSIFNRAISGEFDVVLAMYHDQGHIPVKVYNFELSTSIALGLPFIRTSVDHGTAFDIAGQGKAESRSLEEAIRQAVCLVKGRLP